jgi:hypothetical protein
MSESGVSAPINWESDPQRMHPYQLLGLDASATRDEVLEALRTRLALVADRFSEDAAAASPWRMALHAAALQLMVPATQGFSGSSSAHVALQSQGGASPRLHELADLVLGMHGGWTPASMQHMRMLAHTAGVPEQQLLEYFAAQSAASRSEAPSQQEPSAWHAHVETDAARRVAESVDTSPDDASPTGARVWTYVVITAGVVVGFVVLAIGLRIMTARPNAAPKPIAGATVPLVNPPANAVQASADGTVAKTASTSETAPELSFRDAIAALRASSDPASWKPVDSVWRAMSRGWAQADKIDRIVALDMVVERVYAESRRGGTDGSVIAMLSEDLAQTPPQLASWTSELVLSRVWALAVAARVSGERDLDRRTTELLRRSAGVLASSSVLAGSDADSLLLSACVRVAMEPWENAQRSSIATPSTNQVDVHAPAAWKTWTSAVAQLSGGNVAQRDMAVLRVLDAMLRGSEGQSWTASGDACLRALLPSMDWSEQGQARGRFVRWLGSETLSGEVVSVLTVLVSQQPQAMLDPSFVLSTQASVEERTSLRGRLVRIWSMSSPQEQQEFAERYARVVERVLAIRPVTPIDHLHVASIMSAMCGIAELAWEGSSSAASIALDGIDRSDVNLKPLASESATPTIASTWGVEYISVGSDLMRRRQILTAVQSAPSRQEAAILVRDAVRGPNAEIRQAALRALEPWVRTTEVRRAMLDFVPFMPATLATSQLMQNTLGVTLPPPRDGRWRSAVRRALVQASLGVDGTRAGDLDTTADAFRLQYQDRVETLRGSSFATGMPTWKLAWELRMLRLERVRRDAPRETYDGYEQLQQVVRHREPPKGHDIHAFLAVQADLVRLMAVELRLQPSCSAADVDAVIAQWRTHEQSAAHVFEQIRSGELAHMQLYLLRMRCAQEAKR